MLSEALNESFTIIQTEYERFKKELIDKIEAQKGKLIKIANTNSIRIEENEKKFLK